MSRFASLTVLCGFALALTLTSPSLAQVTDVNDTTSTPIEGAGHDYIKALSDTVNPANGSVSVRINIPVTKGRGLTIPFSFGYDSNGFRHLKPGIYPNYGTVSWVSNTGYTGQGGWIYSIPQLSFDSWVGTAQVLTGYQNGQPVYQNYYCNYATGYTFRDGSGGVHALGVGTRWSEVNPTPQYCMYASVPGGGDRQVAAELTTLAYGQTTGDMYLFAPLKVYTADGTLYYFASLPGASGGGYTQYGLPTYIEDRNGNQITVSGSTFTDTLGRTLFSGSLGSAGQTNTVSVSGINYQVTWKSVSSSYSVTSQWAGPASGPAGGAACTPIPAVNDTQTVVSKITLPKAPNAPNAQAYNFYYGNDGTPHNATPNSYGLLSEIDYPDGGWVQYTWKPSDTTNELSDYPGVINGSCVNQYPCFNPAPAQDACLYQYKTIAVSSRIVSFAGSTPSQTQTFTYSTTWSAPQNGNTLGTTWTSKSTNVTTTDNVLGKSYLTKYVYGYVVPLLPVPFSNTTIPNQIPVESSVSDYDWGNTSNPIRTVTKTWYDQYDLASETVSEAGKTSQTTYCYVGQNCAPVNLWAQLQEKDDYDFGATTPTRKTVTTYQGFTGTVGVIVDTPCKTVVSDSSGNRYAETDFYYDGGATLCGTLSTVQPVQGNAVTVVAGTHDDTNFGQSSTIPRGNLTQKVRWASTGTSPTTTYAYDGTGQVAWIIDPCGNSTCTDVSGSNHKTTFSYADAYTVLSGGQNVSYTPTGQTNAYLTQITDALGHISNFTYDFYSGELTESTDPNSRSTTYLYNDPFARPTQVNFPDGGQKTIAYNDSPYNPSTPSPSVTATTLITSGTNIVNTVALDGMGHTVETILASDPSGADYVNTSYYGIGKPYQVTNPHRTITSPTDGTTTYTYDGLGRTTAINQPDTSFVTTTYDQTSANANAICTTATDETGKSRQSCSDGLGRLIEVDEPGPGATAGSPGTGSITIGGSEQTIPGVSGSASLSVSGGGTCISNGHGGYYPETGTVSVTVNGVQTATGSTSWGGTCDQYGNFTLGPTLAQIASNLASSLAGSAAGVNATSSGTTIQISAKATGTSTNYALSASYTATLSSPFVSVSAPASLTGGKNGASDSGTVAVTVGGFQASTTYGSGSTSSSIASALATQLSASGSPVTVQLSGSTITLTADTTGTASNYSLSGLVTWNTQSFSSPSFNISSSGSTLTGGANSSLGSPLVTLYSYDVLDNLTCSVQKGTDTTAFTSCAAAPAAWRPRSFLYDSLSRLTSSTNPETGTITYSYDANSNVSSMVSPRPGQFATATTAHNYTYDVENRKIQESHNPYDGNQKYAYDVATLTGCSGPSPSWITGATNLVHRTSAICSNYSSSTFSYDPMGRLATERRANEGSSTKTYNTGYAYWKDGSLNTLTYPSGSVVTYQVGGAGRVTNVSDSANNAYANSVTYAPHGALTGMTNGTSGTAIVTQNIYNNRLQPTVLSAKQNGQNPFFSLCYDFHSSTAINSPPCVFNAYTSGNNGNVFQVIDNYDSTRSATFAYDPLNRITQANTVNTTSANCWGEVFTLDNLGNLTNIGGVSGMGSCWHENLTGNPASNLNQLANYCYDAAGNLIQNSACPVVTPTYSYDGENRLSSTAGYTYHYDADGVRMEKSNGTSGTMYWTGPGGQYLTETDLTGSTINEEYVYFNGARIARVDRPSGAVHYYFSDQLSSASTITDPSGNVQERYYYYPYGGLVTSIGSDTNRYKFNGKERDTESNLDEFGARYYASTMGRFMTPDWAAKPTAVPYAHYGNPQSLNLYSYVQNNPTTMGDPDGHISPDGGVLEIILIEEGAVALGHYLAGAGFLGLTAAAAGASPSGDVGYVSPGYPSYYHGELQNADGTSIYLRNSGQSSNAQSSTSTQGQSTPAQPPDGTNGLQKPPTGKGSTPPEERDPKRVWTKAENQRKLDQQNGKCANCGKDTPLDKSRGHHKHRHADGARTNDAEHAVVCEDCHKKLHKPDHPD